MLLRGFDLPVGKVSIHSSPATKFWSEVLGAEEWVMDLLHNGLKPNFINAPSDYAEQNNLSARMNMDFLQEKVKVWQQAGYVKKLSTPPPFH